MMIKRFIQEVRQYYQRPSGTIYLIETVMFGNEYQFIKECLDSGKVSTIGAEVDRFEQQIMERTKSAYAVATSSGTAALHLGLLSFGVQSTDWVITTPFSFVATANAILQAGAFPLFVDIDRSTLGISPTALESFLRNSTYTDHQGQCIHRDSKRRVKACLPVHVFGHPAQLPEIVRICEKYGIAVLEDAAEGLGSTLRGQSVGTYGSAGVLSFNGNKLITTGGGGALVTSDPEVYRIARTIAGQSSQYSSVEGYTKDNATVTSSSVAYNYRMPALNAALGLAQWQFLDERIRLKRNLANWYQELVADTEVELLVEPKQTSSNYWLNALVFPSKNQRDQFVLATNEGGIETRAAWMLLSRYPAFDSPYRQSLPNARWAESCIANVPSTIIPYA